MKTSCFLLIMLCLILVSAAEVMAAQVSPGGLTLQGNMQWVGDGDPLQWVGMAFLPSTEQPGDPQDRLYSSRGIGAGIIGVKDGISNIAIGSYEYMQIILLSGHDIYAFDFTAQALGSGVWANSGNLCLELRDPDTSTVYWASNGPFGSEPIHAYVELAQPVRGYELRLSVVPDASPFIAVLSGLGLLAAYKRRGHSC